MQITSRKNDTAHLTPNEAALSRCQKALELRDKGDFVGAQEVIHALWKGLGQRPDIAGLHPSVVAEVLLCVGILTGWLGSRNQIKEADGWARDLITEAITFYESVGDLRKVAEARVELAYCYWREGSFNEARIWFTEALQKLTTEGKTRANALLGLAVVEWSASRPAEALKILTTNAPLFNKLSHHTMKGFYHNTLAQVLEALLKPEKRIEQLNRVANEYQQADREFQLARNTIFRALAKNNIGNVLRLLGRYKEANQYLEQARRLAVILKDKVRTAQIDQTRVEVMIAQGRFKEAERVAKLAGRAFEKAGRQCLLAEALINRGIALARLGKAQPAQYNFQRAIETAQRVSALNQAGIAALTMIEDLEDLSAGTLRVAYKRASEWLANTQNPDLLRRINTAANRVVSVSHVESEPITEEDDLLLNKPLDFEQEKLKTEKAMIKRALAQSNGSLTRAASLLSMTYQKLAYIIETRHKDLLKERTPIRRRAGKNK